VDFQRRGIRGQVPIVRSTLRAIWLLVPDPFSDSPANVVLCLTHGLGMALAEPLAVELSKTSLVKESASRRDRCDGGAGRRRVECFSHQVEPALGEKLHRRAVPVPPKCQEECSSAASPLLDNIGKRTGSCQRCDRLAECTLEWLSEPEKRHARAVHSMRDLSGGITIRIRLIA
jgi:hypothetical protein